MGNEGGRNKLPKEQQLLVEPEEDITKYLKMVEYNFCRDEEKNKYISKSKVVEIKFVLSKDGSK